MDAPTLAELQRWMIEMPPAFTAEPEGFAGGHVRVYAVMSDLFETLFGTSDHELADLFRPAERGPVERNRLRLALAFAHLLSCPRLRRAGRSSRSLRGLLSQELPTLAAVAKTEELPSNEQLREELIRRTLRALGLGLHGESTAEFEDRLRQVDSVERHRLLREAAKRERRAREVREAMAKKAAQEAAAKVSRE